MKKIIFIVFSCFLTLTSTNVFARTTVAVVDLEALLKDALVAKDIEGKIIKKKEEYQGEVTKNDEQLKAEEQVLIALSNAKGTSPKVLETKKANFITKLKKLQADVDARRKVLDDASAKAGAVVNLKLREIISVIAKDGKYEVVMAKSQLLYNKDTTDITGEVLKKMNENLATTDVSFDEKVLQAPDNTGNL